jgi:DNA invertase Pin-like site-specific DNA recombinase
MAAPISKPEPSRALALLRVSTDKQDVARQRADIEKLRKKYGLTIVEVIELVDVSGRKVLDNKRFLQILADLANRPDIDGLAFSAIDRYFRTNRYSDTGIFQPLADHRKMIWSIREGAVEPWTDEGFDVCMTAALKSGAEWRELRRRTVDGKQEKAEAGFLPHGNAWFGVDIVSRKHTGKIGEGKAVRNEAEAAIVREVFERRRAGASCYEIAAMLNARGIRGKGTNGKPPATFGRKVIRKMLIMKNYIGEHFWKGTVIEVPRIVDDELFYAVQAGMKELGKKWTGRPTKLYLLRRFLYCDRCKHRCIGIRSSGSSKHPKLSYRCGNCTTKPPVKRLCKASQIPAERLEAIVWRATWGLLKQPKLLLEMGRSHYADQNAPNAELMDETGVQINRLKQTDRNLTRMMEEAANDQEYAKQQAKRREIRNQIASLEVQLRTAGRVVNLPPLQMLEAQVRRITSRPEPTTYEGRRHILEGIINFKVMYADGWATITGEVSVSEGAAAGGDGKKRDRGIHADSDNYQPIPFILTERVA